MQQCTLATRQLQALEPKGKLDAMTGITAKVNGPEDALDHEGMHGAYDNESSRRRRTGRPFHVALEACLSRVR